MTQNSLIGLYNLSLEDQDIPKSNRRYSSYEAMSSLPDGQPQPNKRFSDLFRLKKSQLDSESFFSCLDTHGLLKSVKVNLPHRHRSVYAPVGTKTPEIFSHISAISTRTDPIVHGDQKVWAEDSAQDDSERPIPPGKAVISPDLIDPTAEDPLEVKTLDPLKTKSHSSKRSIRLLSNTLSLCRTVAKTKTLCDSAPGILAEKKSKAFDFYQNMSKWANTDRKEKSHYASPILVGMNCHDVENLKKCFRFYDIPYQWENYLTPSRATEWAKIQRQTSKKSRLLDQYDMGQQLALLRLSHIMNDHLSFLRAVDATIKNPTIEYDRRQIQQLESNYLKSPSVHLGSLIDPVCRPRRTRYISMPMENDFLSSKESVSNQEPDEISPQELVLMTIQDVDTIFNQETAIVKEKTDDAKSLKTFKKSIRLKRKKSE